MSYVVGGVVTVNGRRAANVTVRFALAPGRLGIAPAAVRTDKLGRWVQDGFRDRTEYVVTAEGSGLTFKPRSVAVGAERADVNFVGTAGVFTASGVVRSSSISPVAGAKPPGLSGVTIAFERVAGRADLPVPAPVVTAADGTWAQRGFQNGSSFRAMALKDGFAFSPAAVEVRARVSSEFVGTRVSFTVSGSVSTAGHAPEPGVDIVFERVSGRGAVPPTVRSGADGRFTQAGFVRGSQYRATPRKGSLRFDPPSITFALSTGPNVVPLVNLVFQRHTNLVVEGQVLSTAGAGLRGTVIVFERVAGTGAVPRPVTAGSNGEYRAAGLDTATTYRVTAQREGFGFTPRSLLVQQPGTAELNLTGFPAFAVSGEVLGAPAFWLPDVSRPDGGLSDLDPIAGAVVTFQRMGRSDIAPRPAVTRGDGTWSRGGFQVGVTYTVQASAPGFAERSPVGGIGLFGGAAAPRTVTSSQPGEVRGVTIVLFET
jgi:hypothetical protein